MHKAHYTTLILSLLLLCINAPALSMIMRTDIPSFSQLPRELKSLVIDWVDDMSFIGQTNKECYGLVQKKQIDYIIYMYDNQNPLLAKSNIPPFVFSGTNNDF